MEVPPSVPGTTARPDTTWRVGADATHRQVLDHHLLANVLVRQPVLPVGAEEQVDSAVPVWHVGLKKSQVRLMCPLVRGSSKGSGARTRVVRGSDINDRDLWLQSGWPSMLLSSIY